MAHLARCEGTPRFTLGSRDGEGLQQSAYFAEIRSIFTAITAHHAAGE